MRAIETGVEPLAVELPDGSTLTLHAAYPAPVEADEDDPFYLPAPEPVFAPLAVETDLGTTALAFGTRVRAVTEGPRRTSLAEAVTLATGRFADGLATDGMAGVDAPPWRVAVPGGDVPASMTVECAFPWSSPAGRRDSLNIEYVREDGRGAPLLMAAEIQQANQEALSRAFQDFLAANPGLANVLERALAAMDARVMRFEADRLDEVAGREAVVMGACEARETMVKDARTQALHLREGAEVIEENLAPLEPGAAGFVR